MSSLQEKNPMNQNLECDESDGEDHRGNKNENMKKIKKEEKYNQKQEKKHQSLSGTQEQDKLKNDLQKKYQNQSFKYANEGYTIQSNNYIKKMASQTFTSDNKIEEKRDNYARKYPLYKMIRSVVKKFQFNELEIIFFAYLIDFNQWNADEELLRVKAGTWTDYLNITEVDSPLEYRSVLLFLLLNAYAIKTYMNDNDENQIFKQHMQDLIPGFKQLFVDYQKKLTLKINPKKLNEVFSKLSYRESNDQINHKEDYNSLVDAIIQISPPYNNDKGQGNSNKQKGQNQQDQMDSNNNIGDTYNQDSSKQIDNDKNNHPDLGTNQYKTMNNQQEYKDFFDKNNFIDKNSFFDQNINIDSIIKHKDQNNGNNDQTSFNLMLYQQQLLNQNMFQQSSNNIQNINNNSNVGKNQGKTQKTKIIQSSKDNNNNKKEENLPDLNQQFSLFNQSSFMGQNDQDNNNNNNNFSTFALDSTFQKGLNNQSSFLNKND